MFRKLKVTSRLTFSLKQEQVPFLHMRTVENTILNSPIREFIKLIVNCTDGYKKSIKIQFVHSAVMLSGMTAFPCYHLCAERWCMSGSSFRFRHPHHLVGCGVGCALLEEAGNGKDGVAYADFRHTVRAAVGFCGACLFRFCHRLSFRGFISCFNRSSFSCAVSFRKLLSVKLTGVHMESSLS